MDRYHFLHRIKNRPRDNNRNTNILTFREDLNNFYDRKNRKSLKKYEHTYIYVLSLMYHS